MAAEKLDVRAERLIIRPENYLEPLDLQQWFPRRAPLEVDAGSGDGAFLTAMAQRMPGHDFLGIERLLGRVRRSGRRAVRAGVENVRLLRLESSYAVRFLLPPGCVRVFHILFPDPWPKRRHQHRRLVQPAFLHEITRALEPEGEVLIKTDDKSYFRQIRASAAEVAALGEMPWHQPEDWPATDFEARYLRQRLPIYRLRLRKIFGQSQGSTTSSSS